MLKNCKLLSFFITSFFVISLQAYAGNISLNVLDAIQNGIFSIGIGSTVDLQSTDQKINGEALFLGSSILPNGASSYRIYLNKASEKIYYVEPQHFSRINNKEQKILDSYEQVGDTCSAYAINNFLYHMSFSGFVGTGVLNKTLSTEEGRANLLAGAIKEYYLTPAHRYSFKGILNKYGKDFGFTCNLLKTNSYQEAYSHLLTRLNSGVPVIISYNIGNEMASSPLALEIYKQPKISLDERLWIPRKVGERNTGGHSIVATGIFNLSGRDYLTVLDSDWSEPRVWDMDEFLNNEKTALDEVEFITCK